MKICYPLAFQINPPFCVYKVQSWHGEFSSFYFLISDLKISRVIALFNSFGTMFQLLGSRTKILSDPGLIVVIADVGNSALFLRL